MLYFTEVPLSELEKYVEIAFAGDNEFVEKYHFPDKTISELIVNNVKNVIELSQYEPLKCFGIYFNSTPIGFSVMTDKLLYSFGINIEYRKKEIVLKWFGWLKHIFNGVFGVCLNPENTRARDFFIRNGMTILNENNEGITLIYK